jgi:hypothetical protein
MSGANKPLILLRRFFSELGPGVVAGAADDDPSGIVAYVRRGHRHVCFLKNAKSMSTRQKTIGFCPPKKRTLWC